MHFCALYDKISLSNGGVGELRLLIPFYGKEFIMEYVLLAVLLLAALFIIVAVIFQKSGDEGLSSSIAGGNDTYLSKDQAPSTERVWFKWTLIIGLVFAVAVLVTYIIQPDYTYDMAPDYWKGLSEFGDVFGE